MSNALAIKTDERQLQYAKIFKGDNFQNALKTTLPKHVSADRMVRVVLSAMQTNPELLKCSGESVILSVLRAASMGLEPDGGPLGQGYLVPFWNSKRSCKDCQFIPGYRGLIKLARNSGEIADVSAEVVYEKDDFKYELGLEPTLKHKRNDATNDPGPLAYAYAIARFKDGQKKFVVMNKREIDEIKARSPSKNRNGDLVGPWVDWESEMWKKTVVRRLCKLLPLSVEIQSQIRISDGEGHADHDDSISGIFNLQDVAALAPIEDSAEVEPDTIEHTPSEESVSQVKESESGDGEPSNLDLEREDRYRQYLEELAGTEQIIESNKIYDEYFTSKKYSWTPQQNTQAVKDLDARQVVIRGGRGSKSNKSQKSLVS